MKRLPDKDDERNGWYAISPEDASKMLGNQVKNRPVSSQKVEKISASISSGQFCENGESIILDHLGRLSDGQHRLLACIKSGRPIATFVVHMPSRLGAAFFDSIDQGTARSSSDRLAMEDVKYYRQASSVARLVARYERGVETFYGGSYATSNAEVRKTYETIKDEIDFCVSESVALRDSIRPWLSPAVLAFCYLMARRIDAGKAEEWFHAVSTGENLRVSSSVHKLRSQLQRDAMSAIKSYSMDAKIALMTKSWINFRHSYEAQLLTWSPAKGNRMPRFDDSPQRQEAKPRKRSAA